MENLCEKPLIIFLGKIIMPDMSSGKTYEAMLFFYKHRIIHLDAAFVEAQENPKEFCAQEVISAVD